MLKLLTEFASTAEEKAEYTKQADMYETQTKFYCLMADKKNFCLPKFMELQAAPWQGACSGENLKPTDAAKTVNAQCVDHLKTFTSLGCCLSSICKLMGKHDAESKAWCGGDVAVTATPLYKLFEKNSAGTMAPQCARNAFLAKGTLALPVTSTQATKLLPSVQADLQVAKLTSDVTATVGTSRRRLNGATSTTISYTAAYPNKGSAEKFGKNNEIKLASTQKAAAAEGISVPDSVTATGGDTVTANPTPTGQVSAEPDASVLDAKVAAPNSGSAPSPDANSAGQLKALAGMFVSLGLALLVVA